MISYQICLHLINIYLEYSNKYFLKYSIFFSVVKISRILKNFIEIKERCWYNLILSNEDC